MLVVPITEARIEMMKMPDINFDPYGRSLAEMRVEMTLRICITSRSKSLL